MKQHGPWKIIESKTVYKNPWIEVVEDKVIRPDGKEGIYGTVRKGLGVAVLPIDDEGYVYLAEEFKYAIGRVSLETVAGAVDSGEEPLAAAKRELKEEAGIEAKEWIDLGSEDPFTSVVDAKAQMYLARRLTFGDSHEEGTEIIQIKKMPLNEAVDRVMDGTISMAQSALLILKAKIFLESQSK